MAYAVFLHPKANDVLEKSDSELKERIRKKLAVLCNEPHKKGKRLRHSQYYRLRIGDYRAIYEVWHDERKVVVLFIGHRSTIYDDFTKLL